MIDPLVTHKSYLSALEVQHDEALYKSTFTLLCFNETESLVYTFTETTRMLYLVLLSKYS